MIKYIVFLGLGINQIEFIEAAKSLGYKIIGFDRREPSYCREICDHYYKVAINKKYAVQEIVSNFTNIIGCISEQTDTALETVGFINSKLGLCGPTQFLTSIIRNKYLQRKSAESFGIAQPKFLLHKNRPEFLTEFENEFFNVDEVVIKPVVGQSSIGLFNYEVKNIIEALNKGIDPFLTIKKEFGEVLVEEKLNGKDISIDGFVSNGFISIAIVCEKIKNRKNLFVDQILIGSGINNKKYPNELNFVERLIATHKLNNSYFHNELKKCEDEIKLIEWTCRGGGSGLSSTLVSNMLGLDYPKIRIQLLESDKTLKLKPNDDVIGTMMFFDDYSRPNNEKLAALKNKAQYWQYSNIEKILQCDLTGIRDGRDRKSKLIACFSKKRVKSSEIEESLKGAVI